MITEDYVSFETAKLLKEKGFNENTDKQFNSDKIVGDYNITDRSRYPERYLDAPTLQMAMKWLREVHKLYITVVPFPLNFEHEDIQDGWGCEVTHLSDLSYDGNYEFFQKRYPTHEEATEAAIKYCLENLI